MKEHEGISKERALSCVKAVVFHPFPISAPPSWFHLLLCCCFLVSQLSFPLLSP